jgi:hypothetical protein
VKILIYLNFIEFFNKFVKIRLRNSIPTFKVLISGQKLPIYANFLSKLHTLILPIISKITYLVLDNTLNKFWYFIRNLSKTWVTIIFMKMSFFFRTSLYINAEFRDLESLRPGIENRCEYVWGGLGRERSLLLIFLRRERIWNKFFGGVEEWILGGRGIACIIDGWMERLGLNPRGSSHEFT